MTSTIPPAGCGRCPERLRTPPGWIGGRSRSVSLGDGASAARTVCCPSPRRAAARLTSAPGLPGHEEAAIARSVVYDLGGGRAVRVGSAEVLVMHEPLAGRALDVLDLEGIVARQGRAVDVAYVRRWLSDLGRVADDSEVSGTLRAHLGRDRPSPVRTHPGG